MTTKVASLRGDIRELAQRRARGDIAEKTFHRETEKLTVELSRALVRERLAPDEPIRAEHHVIRAHTKLTGSVLRESEQETISLLATDRRLFRLRSRHGPAEAVLFSIQGRDQIEEIPFGHIQRIAVRRQIRIGEILVGVVIAAAALVFRSSLRVTGIALVAVGIAGVLHGLLVPTRWADVITPGSAGERFQIFALRKRSARRLIRLLSAGAGGG